jgi:hypothetical protein
MQSKMGKLLSADYVVSGVITELSTDKTKSNQTRAVFRGSMKITKAATGEHVGTTSVFNMAYIGGDLITVYKNEPEVGGNPSTLCMLKSTDFWAKHVEATLGPSKVCGLKLSRGRGKKAGSWSFTLTNSGGNVEPGQVLDVFIQEFELCDGVQVPLLSQDLLSVKVTRSEGKFAFAKMHLLDDEEVEDFLETLSDLSKIVSDDKQSESVIAKRRL